MLKSGNSLVLYLVPTVMQDVQHFILLSQSFRNITIMLQFLLNISYCFPCVLYVASSAKKVNIAVVLKKG